MSLTTRCPACGTMFKVVPDQLKISDGWVRCGHCADVFDATLYLETWTPPVPEASPPVMDDQAAVPEPRGAAGAEHAPNEPASVTGMSSAGADGPWTSWDSGPEKGKAGAAHEEAAGAWPKPGLRADHPGVPDDSPAGRSLPAAVTQEVQTVVPAAAPVPQMLAVDQDGPEPAGAGSGNPSRPSGARQVDAEESDFHTELQRFAAHTAGTPPNAEGAGAEPAVVSDPEPRREPDLVPASDDDAAEQPEPGFMRQARRRAFWTSPGMRVLLSLLALLLGGLLGGQWVLHQRDHLAASHPEWVPLLSRLCEPLGCEIGAVRRIDAVVIDSSSLVRRLGNFYSFDFVLKNTGPIPLAVPALELSLTDTRDAVIARRVFLPEELPGVPPLLPARDSVTVSLRLSMAVGDALPMAGYRALVFYP